MCPSSAFAWSSEPIGSVAFLKPHVFELLSYLFHDAQLGNAQRTELDNWLRGKRHNPDASGDLFAWAPDGVAYYEDLCCDALRAGRRYTDEQWAHLAGLAGLTPTQVELADSMFREWGGTQGDLLDAAQLLTA